MTLFRRRRSFTFWERVRVIAAPPGGWRRSFVYFYRRTLRLSASPHAIAMGVSMGVFASCTPLVGFHILLAMGLAWMVGGNVPASVLGTIAGNPLTFPLLWALSYSVGDVMLGQIIAPAPELPESAAMASAGRALLRTIVGAAPVGGSFAALIYLPVRMSVGAYQNARKRRLRARRVMIIQTSGEEPRRGPKLILAPKPDEAVSVRGGKA